MTTKVLVIAGAIAAVFGLSACEPANVDPATPEQFSIQKVEGYECVVWVPTGAEADSTQMHCFDPRSRP